MAKKRTGKLISNRPDYVIYEDTYNFKDVVLDRGKEIKIKNTRGVFTFYNYGKNMKTDKDWVTCIHVTGGYFQSFRPEEIKEIVKPKVPERSVL